MIRSVHIALAVAGFALGMVLSAGALLISQRRQPVAYDCGISANPELILQSGSEYILANPSVEAALNSYLVSRELRDPAALPARWRFQDVEVLQADDRGFQLRGTQQGGGDRIEFSTSTGEWKRRPAGDGSPDLIRCRRLAALPQSASRLNGIPLHYLLIRPWPIPLLNPDLSAGGVRLALARALAGRAGSEYSFYKLVSTLPRTALSTADEERLLTARKALLVELGSSFSFWEYGGNSGATWEFSNEQGEAEGHAETWCRQQSEGSLTSRLSDGYQVVSSVPRVRESGQQRALYPDGRFSGYVNYTASCQGTEHTLRKDGDLGALQ
ncbi:MAG: hypothetical protein VKI83_00255 [Synechococcaceae cyanobacterium]|nr:hypothetical protein [Synechococcaceae cyanobacterium]